MSYTPPCYRVFPVIRVKNFPVKRLKNLYLLKNSNKLILLTTARKCDIMLSEKENVPLVSGHLLK